MIKGDDHAFFGHVMPLAPPLASYDSSGIISGTNAFV